MKISIVIPVYNEKPTLREVLRRVLEVPLPALEREVVIVDGCSTDGTRELLADLPALLGDLANAAEFRVLLQERSLGKGAALRDGFAAFSGDIVLIQDADLEYNPQDYLKLLAPLLAGEADVVYGSRFTAANTPRFLSSWHALVNRGLTWLSNAFTGLRLSDIECCYKVFRREVIARIQLEEDRFGADPELTAKVARLGCRVQEVGVGYQPRTHAEGKKIGWRDGFSAIRCILKYSLRP